MQKIQSKLFILFLIFFQLTCYAGQSVLDNKISIHIDGISLEQALETIESEGNVMFSYNPETLPVDSLVSAHFEQTSISSVLQKMVGKIAHFKSIGTIVVIKALPTIPYKKQEVNVSGNLIDSQTGKQIEDATVFVIGSAEAVLTNANGNYDLDVTSKEEYVEVYYSKPHYQDTVVVVKASEADSTVVYLRPLEIDVEKIKQEIKDEVYNALGNLKLFISEQEYLLTDNLKHIEIPGGVQVSLVPYISTNGALNGNTINHASLNILGGYSGGLQGVEVGGIANVDLGNITGLQTAGVVNVVGGNSLGLQIAGVNNITKGSVLGAQIAGVNNIAIRKIKGAQIAGFANISRDTLIGLQASGFANISASKAVGSQIAGFTNITAGKFTGLQLAGFSNHAGNVDGMQISAIMNSARHVRGVQLGLINYADTVQGVSLGLLNIVKKGFIAFELGSSDVYDGSFLFKTGTDLFYNIFNVGYINHNNSEYASVGYGLGTRFQKKDGIVSGDFEVIYNSIFPLQNELVSLSNTQQLLDVNLGLGIDFWKVFTIHAGPVVHAQYQEESTLRLSQISPMYSTTLWGNNLDAWVGWNASLRIQL